MEKEETLALKCGEQGNIGRMTEVIEDLPPKTAIKILSEVEKSWRDREKKEGKTACQVLKALHHVEQKVKNSSFHRPTG